MDVPQFVVELKAMQQAPDATKAQNLVQALREKPDLAKQAKPVLMLDPTFAAAYRTLKPGADYEYHNTSMPMPRAIKSPTCLNDLTDLVQKAATEARTLKAMGDGYGFANAAFTPDYLVHCAQLDDVLPVEDELFLPGAPPAESLVRVQAGITFGKLNAWLAAKGRTLPQQPGFSGLTVLGCCSSGGHGSGLSLQGMSSQIAALELVTLNESNQVRVVRIEPESAKLTNEPAFRARYAPPMFDLVQDDDLFHAARCGQGNLGIVYAATFKTVPHFFLEETRIYSTWSQVWPTVRDVLLNGPTIHSVHLWINPYRADPTVILTRLTKTTATVKSGQRGIGVCLGGLNPITELVRALVAIAPGAIPFLNDEALKSCAANNVVMPCTEALDFGAPNEMPVLATSLGFDASKVEQVFPALMKEINAWKAQNQWISSPIGMRWVKASQDFLSPQYGRDTIMLEVPCLKGTPNAAQTLDRYATYMIDTWGARPHWGQQNPMGRTGFESVYKDSLPRFLPAYRALNPNGFFDGPLARQLGLRDLANGL